MKFCSGSPSCDVCGAPHTDGEIQNCPSPIRKTKNPKRRGIGTLAAGVFAKLGFKKKPGCGCGKREKQWNRWGWKIADRILRYLNPPITKSERRAMVVDRQKRQPSLSEAERLEAKARRRLAMIERNKKPA